MTYTSVEQGVDLLL